MRGEATGTPETTGTTETTTGTTGTTGMLEEATGTTEIPGTTRITGTTGITEGTIEEVTNNTGQGESMLRRERTEVTGGLHSSLSWLKSCPLMRESALLSR